jgi:thymidylate synthase
MFLFEAATASDLWIQAWTEAHGNGSLRQHPRGDSRELIHAALCLSAPRQRWVLSRTPAINPAFALAEVIWIMRGRDDAAFLTAWNNSLPQYAGSDSNFYGAYGTRLRTRFGVDQLKRAAQALRHRPDQRQIVLQIWDPRSDLPLPDGSPRATDIPCNITATLKVSEGRLEWLQVMRSNDIVRGLPYNLVQWTTIHEVLAGWLGLELGEYLHVSDSLHVYSTDEERFQAGSIPPVTVATDLRLAEDESERTFRELELISERLTATMDAGEVKTLALEIDVSAAYQDWVYVLAAERFRRLGDPESAHDLVQKVGDTNLRTAAKLWHAR